MFQTMDGTIKKEKDKNSKIYSLKIMKNFQPDLKQNHRFNQKGVKITASKRPPYLLLYKNIKPDMGAVQAPD